jgi:mannose-6-phosphate isomerase-like protein (cupin superfamily)
MIMKIGFVLSAFLFGIFASQEASAPAPVAVENEPRHHLVLKNDSVMVLHVILPASETTLYHTHVHDRVAIEFASASTTQQKFGESEGGVRLSKPGDISLPTADSPYTHRVHNVGSTVFDVLDVEILKRPQIASTSATTGTSENRMAGENPSVGENPSTRVYKWVLAPGGSSPTHISAMHTHVRPYLIVSVTAFNLKMTDADGQSMTVALKPGDYYWVNTRVTHTLENVSPSEGQIVEVELK